MLTVRLASAQWIPPPSYSTPRIDSSSGSGINIFFGIFGVMFVVSVALITFGAFKVHRNPERYGARPATPGRPKQTRAKGITRAILESIPIAKFGQNREDANTTTQRDVELAVTSPDSRIETTTLNTSISPQESGVVTTKSDQNIATRGVATEALPAARSIYQTLSGSVECSICLEDFVKDEAIRLLPCNHKFHPACIDPWLLNVATTCPICRYNLLPATTTSDPITADIGTLHNTAVISTTEALAIPPPVVVSDHASNGSRFRELRRVHAGHEEYIAALRQLYHELESHRTSSTGNREEPSVHLESRPRSRLRDAFNIQLGPLDNRQNRATDRIRVLQLIPQIG